MSGSMIMASMHVGIVVVATQLGRWLGNWNDSLGSDARWSDGVSPDGETESEELDQSARRARAVEALKAQIAERAELGIWSEQLAQRSERKPWPRWVERLGGFQKAMVLVTLLHVAALAYELLKRPENFFEILRISPFELKSPMIGLTIRNAIHKGGLGERGLSREEIAIISSTFFSAELRQRYDMHGTSEPVPLSTIGDLVRASKDQIVFYLAWMCFMVVVKSASDRYAKLLNTSGIALGVAFFLDICITPLGLIEARDILAIKFIPIFNMMTVSELVFQLRNFGVPLLMSACVLHSGFSFVDYDEHALEYILEMIVDDVAIEKSVDNTIVTCQMRREILSKAKESSGRSSRNEGVVNRAVPSVVDLTNDASESPANPTNQGAEPRLRTSTAENKNKGKKRLD